MLGLGLQHKTIDTLSTELDLPSSQLLGLFNRSMRRTVQFLVGVMEKSVEEMLKPTSNTLDQLNPMKQGMQQELEEAAKVCIFNIS